MKPSIFSSYSSKKSATSNSSATSAVQTRATPYIPWFVSPQNNLFVPRGWHGLQIFNSLSGFLKIGLAGEQSEKPERERRTESESGGREREDLEVKSRNSICLFPK
jgi:hypothetical protein